MLDRLENDQAIQTERPILQVKNISLHASFVSLRMDLAAPSIVLRPARENSMVESSRSALCQSSSQPQKLTVTATNCQNKVSAPIPIERCRTIMVDQKTLWFATTRPSIMPAALLLI